MKELSGIEKLELAEQMERDALEAESLKNLL